MVLLLPYVQHSGSRPRVSVTPAELPPSSYQGFFSRYNFFTRGHQKIRLPRNLINLGVFWSRFFKWNLNSKYIAHKQIKFDRNLILPSSRRSGNNLGEKTLRSHAWITLPASLSFFAQKSEKVNKKYILREKSNTRPSVERYLFGSEPPSHRHVYDYRWIRSLFDSRSEFKFK
jgi:hypothetical protein